MKVIEAVKPGELRISERPMPGDPAAGEVIIRIKAAGICGSDVHIAHGKNPFATYPRIIGHEVVGEIVQIGNSVNYLQPGDRVAVDNVFSCGACYACKLGRGNVCRRLKVLGVHVDGGFQEYLKVAAANVHKFPDTIDWPYAATIEPYSIAAETLDRGKVRAADTVLICGAGPVGLILLQAVKRIGARAAIMDILDSRLERAKAMHADLVINAKTTDVTAAVMQFTDGEGAGVVLEATGVNSVLELAVAKLVAQAGRVVVLGFSVEPVKLAPADIMRRELDIYGTRLNNQKFPEVITWLSNKEVDPAGIISHVLPFTEAAKGIELFDRHPEEVCKVILTF